MKSMKNLQNFSEDDDRIPYKTILSTASRWKFEWKFIDDPILLTNISYHLLYIDFLISTYNTYRLYGVIESLISKDIIIKVNDIIESVLHHLLVKYESKENIPYIELIGKAYKEHKIISKELWHQIHELRKLRNLRHIQSVDKSELDVYKIENANDSLSILDEFREEIEEYTKKS